MGISVVEITSVSQHDTTNHTENPAVFTTPSNTADALALYLLMICGVFPTSATPGSPVSVAGMGLGSWASAGVDGNGGSASLDYGWGAWLASSASPGAGAGIAITFGSADMNGCGYSLYKITGHKPSGYLGQVNQGQNPNNDTIATALASATPRSAILGFCVHDLDEAITVEGGWTEGEENGDAGSSRPRHTSAYGIYAAGGDLSIGYSFAGTEFNAAMIIEILAASGSQVIMASKG